MRLAERNSIAVQNRYMRGFLVNATDKSGVKTFPEEIPSRRLREAPLAPAGGRPTWSLRAQPRSLHTKFYQLPRLTCGTDVISWRSLNRQDAIPVTGAARARQGLPRVREGLTGGRAGAAAVATRCQTRRVGCNRPDLPRFCTKRWDSQQNLNLRTFTSSMFSDVK